MLMIKNHTKIKATKPGQNYEIRVNPERIEGAKLFQGRNRLLTNCRSLLGENIVACEVGVLAGDFSVELQKTLSPQKLYLIDTNTKRVKERFAGEAGIEIIEGVSWESLESFPDNSFDYIYIDADHSYEAVSKDIKVAHKKIKSGGIIQCNDYTNFSLGENMQYGVLYAVNEYLEDIESVSVVGLSLDRSGYHDIALLVGK